MAKLEKILKKWSSNPKEVRKEEVISVLERYDFEIDLKRGSHIVVSHAKLIDQPDFGRLGEFTVPTKNGRYVKGFYLQKILLAISIIEEGG